MWDEALDAWWWLTKFKQPPREVDELPAHLYVRIREVENVADVIREEKAKT